MIREEMTDRFRKEFGRSPEFFISAPGRVNLIGEHTDYNGYPVLPMSIPFTVRAAASPRSDRGVVVRNTDPDFPPREFLLERDIPPAKAGDWSNYVRAAVQRLIERYGAELGGMDVLFEGDVPSSAGLSSSSALVIASALAVLSVNGIDCDAVELAEMMAEGERYVGTQGGGMDQAICLLGREGKAVRIDFFPLRHAYADFPEGCSILVAHSLIRAAKTENALVQYNRRPAECRLATAILNSVFQPGTPLRRLGDLPRTDILSRFRSVGDFVEQTFPAETCSLREVSARTGESPESLTAKYLMTRGGVPMPEPEDGFRIRSRVLHVLTEAERVERSCAALGEGDAEGFGRLMNESHRSCDEWYGISTPELNALVSIMTGAGALGARLTGAGFGGCAIALVRDRDLDTVKAAVRREYYGAYLPETHPELRSSLSGEPPLFDMKPARGARAGRV